MSEGKARTEEAPQPKCVAGRQTVYTAEGEPWHSLGKKMLSVEDDVMAFVAAGKVTKPDARDWLARNVGSIERAYEMLLDQANVLSVPSPEVLDKKVVAEETGLR